MKTLKRTALIISTLAILSLPLSLRAEDHMESLVNTNGWDFRIGIPIWAASAEGNIGVHNREAHVDESFSDIKDDLDCYLGLNLEIRRCRWLLYSDNIYLKTSQEGEPDFPNDDAFRQVNVSQKQLFSDVGFGYAIVESHNLLLEAYAAARLTFVEGDLSFTGPLVQFSDSQSKFWADPIIGLRAKYALTPHVALYARGDVGGFGWVSDLTYELQGGLDFTIVKHFNIALTYRYLSMDYSSGGFTYDIATGGPQLELGFRF